MTSRVDVVQAPSMDIRTYLTELKKVVKVLTKNVDIAPLPTLPTLLLVALILDIDSLILDFYTHSFDLMILILGRWKVTWSLKKGR